MSGSVYARTFVLVAALLATRQIIAGRSPVETPLQAPLAAFPLDVEAWRGTEAPAFSPEIERTLDADEYIHRLYWDGGETAVALYVAYYATQRHGDAIHSPQHCLPGTGWEPVSRSRVTVEATSGRFSVNRYIVQRRAQRQLVMYWFQGRGRSVASEYVNKFHLLADGLLQRRTDGALVRVIAPVTGAEHLADAAALRFVQTIHPQLGRWLP
jgi:EpsI family protein